MTTSTRIKSYQAAIVTLTTLLALLFLHWFVTRPIPVSAANHELTFWAWLLFRVDFQSAAYAPYLALTLGLMATTGLVACALAVLLAMRVPNEISARRLAWALVSGSLAAGYVFFVTTHTEYRAVLAWTPASPIRLACDFAAYTAGMLSPLFMARFFLSYPRALRLEEWEAEALRRISLARKAMLAPTAWRRWLYPAGLRRWLATPTEEDRRFKFTSDAEQARLSVRTIRWARSKSAVLVLVCWALFCAVMDWQAAQQATILAPSKPSLLLLGRNLLSICWILVPILTLDIVSKSLHIYSASATPDDRRKIDWIRSTLVIGGILVACAQVGGMAVMPFVLTSLGNSGSFLPIALVVQGPLFVPVQLLVLAFVISLAVSIFYRGAVDPRLAARKLTLFGVLGMLLAFLFVAMERVIASKIVSRYGLSPDTSAPITFGVLAATVAPVKRYVEKTTSSFLGRYLPLDLLMKGERKVLVVGLSDLSGYTLLSSHDEKHALLLAALLQRQAARMTAVHGGRIVKSMGDAVLFAFDNSSSAAKVLIALHRGFESAAEQFGLTALQIHSGAHAGEVIVAHDGDIYGQTVNVAARIQGRAAPGQIVVSEAFVAADAIGSAAYSDLGPQQFKNVVEPIRCHELLLLPSPIEEKRDSQELDTPS